MGKVTREKFKVYNNVFDEHTLRTLNRLSARGYFIELESQISLGKEANVFSAVTDDGDYVIVKIYRVENCNFNKMYDYIRQDTRFIGIKKQRRKVIFTWVMREFRNLLKARESDVLVPKPIAVMDNILVLEFLGNKNFNPPIPSPQLKNSEIEDSQKMYDSIINNIKKMHGIGLVHADLSAFNILNKDQVPYFIDFSQATTIESLDYLFYLHRDLINVCSFFKKYGIDKNPNDEFEKITKKKPNFII
jgi:RIO kinase 1